MFKCQEGYTLRKIKGVSYILPFGQQIADQRKGTILNETSAFLWNVIQHNEGADLEMLTEMLARRYGLAEENFPMLREDILDFLRQLQSMGMLTETLRLQFGRSLLMHPDRRASPSLPWRFAAFLRILR